MFKTSKQSLSDWQVTKNGAAFAWITKLSNGLYSLTFREFGKSVDYTFRFHKEAVAFAKTI
jgi:hypothetical protein